MAQDTTTTYDVRISGLWRPVHTISTDGQELGKLVVSRNPWGMIHHGRYSPEKGEVLEIRRDPGLLRSQFSLWTEGREWLGSSLRWSFVQREVVLHTGSKPLRLLPTEELGVGWTLQAPRTGEMARIHGNLLSQTVRIEVFRRLEFETVVFAHFLASMILRESFLPGPHVEAPMPKAATPPAPAKASAKSTAAAS